MTRANRIFSAGYVWHITHRCHNQQFLLRFAFDRQRWRHWLYVARRRYGLCVLNYMVTSNHVHLLVFDRGNGEIAESMQLIEGRVAQEYNQRKNRRGAFWEDRYHATAVQTDQHLARCLIYMDLNMVRAGAVRHPREWRFSGYHELCDTTPKRKMAIDFEKLCALSGASSLEQHRAWRSETIDRELLVSRREAVWTTTAAVGNSQFLAEFQQSLGVAGRHKQIAGWQHGEYLRETSVPYSAELAAKQPIKGPKLIERTRIHR